MQRRIGEGRNADVAAPLHQPADRAATFGNSIINGVSIIETIMKRAANSPSDEEAACTRRQ